MDLFFYYFRIFNSVLEFKIIFSSRAPVSLTSAWPQKGDADGVKNPNSNSATSQMDSILRFFTDTEVS